MMDNNESRRGICDEQSKDRNRFFLKIKPYITLSLGLRFKCKNRRLLRGYRIAHIALCTRDLRYRLSAHIFIAYYCSENLCITLNLDTPVYLFQYRCTHIDFGSTIYHLSKPAVQGAPELSENIFRIMGQKNQSIIFITYKSPSLCQPTLYFASYILVLNYLTYRNQTLLHWSTHY